MWTRAWRFANVYAYAAIDLLYTLLWFAAFIAVAVWQAGGVKDKPSNKNNSRDDSNKKPSNESGSCSNFAYGSASKCEVAKASVGFGVIVFLLFAVTSAISVRDVLTYRKTGIMPNGNTRTHGQAEQVGEDPNKDAWSTNTDELDQNHPSNRPSTSPEHDVDPRRAYGQIPEDEDQQNLLHRSSLQHEDPFQDTHSMTEHGMHPGRPASFHSATSAGLSIAPPPSYHERPPNGDAALSPTGYVAPSALSPSDYEQTSGGRINFPQGNYSAVNFR
jgi:hypothetical protein